MQAEKKRRKGVSDEWGLPAWIYRDPRGCEMYWDQMYHLIVEHEQQARCHRGRPLK